MNRKLLLDIVFTVLFFYYGYKYRYLTPSFETKKGGITTTRMKMNRTNWQMGHEFAGTVCFIYAALMALLLFLKVFYIGYGSWFDWAHLVLEIAAVISLPFLIDIKLRRDGSDDVEKDDKEAPVGGPGLRDQIKARKAASGNSYGKSKNGKKGKKRRK